MRNFLINAAVVIVAILVSLGGAEILLRSSPSLISIDILERFHPDLRTPIAERLGFATGKDRRQITPEERGDGGPTINIYHPDRLYHALVDPADAEVGAVVEQQTDGNGFCNPPGTDGGGPVDVLMLGDSFTDCTLVNAGDTFTALIAAQTGLTTYQLGVRGIGPYEELVLLRKFGLAMKPRVVVLNLYEGNDLRDVVQYHEFLDGAPDKGRQKRTGGVFAVSYALAYLKAGIRLTYKRLKPKKRIDFRYSVDVQGVRTPMNVTNSDIDEVKRARMVASGKTDLDLFEEPLRAFVALAREEGFIPVVTLHPSAHTGYLGRVVFEDEAVGRDVAGFSDAQRSWLAENAGRIGYRFIDVVPAFHDQVGSRPLAFFPANVHYTRDGHAIVADVLGPELKALLPD